jgi:hypothetical protein
MTRLNFLFVCVVCVVLSAGLFPGAAGAAGSSEPFSGDAMLIPGVIQAEDYNEGGANVSFGLLPGKLSSSQGYRGDGVSIMETRDNGGGYHVGNMAKGEWLAYTVTIADAGYYSVDARVASAEDGGFRMSVAGVDCFGAQGFFATGSPQAWKTVTVPSVWLPQGTYELRFSSLGDKLNLNWLSVTKAAQTPYGGTPRNVPGWVQAEDYDNGGQNVAYYDNTPGNICYYAAYRFQDVDVENNPISGSTVNVGWIASGEWLEYTINVTQTGIYRVSIMAACPTGGGVNIYVGGHVMLKTMTPTGGSNQTYKLYSVGQVPLSQGQHIVKVQMMQGLWNFDSLWFMRRIIIFPPSEAEQSESDLSKSPDNLRELD